MYPHRDKKAIFSHLQVYIHDIIFVNMVSRHIYNTINWLLLQDVHYLRSYDSAALLITRFKIIVTLPDDFLKHISPIRCITVSFALSYSVPIFFRFFFFITRQSIRFQKESVNTFVKERCPFILFTSSVDAFSLTCRYVRTGLVIR